MRFFRDIREAVARNLGGWYEPCAFIYNRFKIAGKYALTGFAAANALVVQSNFYALFFGTETNYCNGRNFTCFYRPSVYAQWTKCPGETAAWMSKEALQYAQFQWQCAIVIGTLTGLVYGLCKALGGEEPANNPVNVRVNVITTNEDHPPANNPLLFGLFQANNKTFTQRLEAVGYDVTDGPEVFFCNLTKTFINKPVLFLNRICDEDQVLQYLNMAAEAGRGMKDPFSTDFLRNDIRLERIVSLNQDIETFVLQKEKEYKLQQESKQANRA